MNAHLPLYRFIHDGDCIGVARVTEVRTRAGLREGTENLSIDLVIEESLWGDVGSASRSYTLERPASRTTQLKFPDPVWGSADLRSGKTVLVVMAPASTVPAANPAYVDEVPLSADPVLRSIRNVLEAERGEQTDAERFHRRLRWLTTGDAVQKLFAGEALASDDVPQPKEAERQLDLAFASTFAREQDVYLKISLGTWLWEQIYERASESSRVSIVNATVDAARSSSAIVRTYALDRLSGVDPELLRNPGIKSSREVEQLLLERRELEVDADAREKLSKIIAALRR